MNEFLSKIDSRSAVIGVIGLGYVGLPLAVEFAAAGFKVIGFEVAQDKIEKVNRGENYIKDVDDAQLTALAGSGRISATADFSRLAKCDSISICVPTPLSKMHEPELSYIIAATSEVKKYIKNETLVVLESTTYPGNTEEMLLPALSEGGREVGKDFYLAFSPERVDPGNPVYKTHNTPKVIGGVTEECRRRAKAVYGAIIDPIVLVSSTTAAEMVKLVENTFRAINIANVNEIAKVCHKLGLDVWEIIGAAATKPFGFVPFYPGPGLGGHCIPIDPLYLSWKMKSLDFRTQFIDLANDINRSMPHWVVSRIEEALLRRDIEMKDAKILVLGVAYKRDIDDARESPAIDVISHLIKECASVEYYDPYIPECIAGETEDEKTLLKSSELTPELISAADLVVCTTDHSCFDWPFIIEHAVEVFDARNATKGIDSEKVIKL